jgi:hypothetical protein
LRRETIVSAIFINTSGIFCGIVRFEPYGYRISQNCGTVNGGVFESVEMNYIIGRNPREMEKADFSKGSCRLPSDLLLKTFGKMLKKSAMSVGVSRNSGVLCVALEKNAGNFSFPTRFPTRREEISAVSGEFSKHFSTACAKLGWIFFEGRRKARLQVGSQLAFSA